MRFTSSFLSYVGTVSKIIRTFAGNNTTADE